MKIIECTQNSPEWWELHRGIATASSFDRVMTPKQMKLSAQADDLIAELIAQRLSPEMSMIPEGFVSKAMLNGIALEPEARRWYEFTRGVTVEQVGFVTTDCGRFGCSPDARIPSENGALELKCPQPKTHVRYLIDNELPAEYRCQVHGELIVCEADWVDFVSYCPLVVDHPTFMVRVTRNEFTEALEKCLDAFWEKFTEAVNKLPKSETQ